MKKAVKKIIDGENEDKYTNLRLGYSNPLPLNNTTGIGSYGEPDLNVAYGLMPRIEQGVAQGQRLGDKVRPKSMVVDWVISFSNPLSEAGTSLPLLVRLMVLKSKTHKDMNTLSSNLAIASDLFQLQSDIFGGAFYRTDDINARINRKQYTTITDKVMKLERGTGSDPNSVNSYVGDVTCVSPSSVHRFRTRIACPTWLYAGGSVSTYPSNFAPFFTVCWAQANGDTPVDSPPTALTYLLNPIAVSYTVHLDYEDA